MKAAACIAAAIFLAGVAPVSAHACTPAQGWPKRVQLDPAKVATALAASATYIDLAVVEELHPDFVLAEKAEMRMLAEAEPGWTAERIRQWYASLREEMAEDGVRAAHRVTVRLKGVGSDTFDLNGWRWMAVGGATEANAPRSIKLPTDLKYFLDQTDLTEVEGPGDCYTPLLPIVGQTYLVFRDANGELSRAAVPVRFRGEVRTVPGPVYIPVSGPGDPWVVMVRKALEGR